jgi:hypothetical protein
VNCGTKLSATWKINILTVLESISSYAVNPTLIALRLYNTLLISRMLKKVDVANHARPFYLADIRQVSFSNGEDCVEVVVLSTIGMQR